MILLCILRVAGQPTLALLCRRLLFRHLAGDPLPLQLILVLLLVDVVELDSLDVQVFGLLGRGLLLLIQEAVVFGVRMERLLHEALLAPHLAANHCVRLALIFVRL